MPVFYKQYCVLWKNCIELCKVFLCILDLRIFTFLTAFKNEVCLSLPVQLNVL